MFNTLNALIDEATQRVIATSERVRRLEETVSREAEKTIERTTAHITRLNDSFGKLESVSVDTLKSAEALLTRAGDTLEKRLLEGIDPARAARALDAIASAVDAMSARAQQIILDAGSIIERTAASAMRVGQSLSNAVAGVSDALARVDQSLSAALGGSAALPPEIELTEPASSGPASDAPNSMFANAHLLILVTMDMPAESFFFNLSTAGYNSLRRQTSYNVTAQDRLLRRPALQAVSQGAETITVSGAIFTKQSGALQMNQLRDIAFRMVPVMLTTGYGEALGQFYISRIEEDQEGLFPDGMPRKQSFTLEFQRYGEDYSNV